MTNKTSYFYWVQCKFYYLDCTAECIFNLVYLFIYFFPQSCLNNLSRQGISAETIWGNLISRVHPVSFLHVYISTVVVLYCMFVSLDYLNPRVRQSQLIPVSFLSYFICFLSLSSSVIVYHEQGFFYFSASFERSRCRGFEWKQ